jgi:hypothetical protein
MDSHSPGNLSRKVEVVISQSVRRVKRKYPSPQWVRCVRILLHETEIDSLIEKGFLKQERRHDSDAVPDATDVFICSALGGAA